MIRAIRRTVKFVARRAAHRDVRLARMFEQFAQAEMLDAFRDDDFLNRSLPSAESFKQGHHAVKVRVRLSDRFDLWLNMFTLALLQVRTGLARPCLIFARL